MPKNIFWYTLLAFYVPCRKEKELFLTRVAEQNLSTEKSQNF
jgi:hypothetical protein